MVPVCFEPVGVNAILFSGNCSRSVCMWSSVVKFRRRVILMQEEASVVEMFEPSTAL